MPSRLNLPYIDLFSAAIGTFDIEDEDVDLYQQDRMVVMVMVASVGGGRLAVNESDGTRKWTHKVRPISVRVATGEMRSELVELFHLANPGDQLYFDLGLGDQPVPRPRTTEQPAAAAEEPAAQSAADVSTPVQANRDELAGEDELGDEPDDGWVPPPEPSMSHEPTPPAATGPRDDRAPRPKDPPGMRDFFSSENPSGVIRAG